MFALCRSCLPTLDRILITTAVEESVFVMTLSRWTAFWGIGSWTDLRTHQTTVSWTPLCITLLLLGITVSYLFVSRPSNQPPLANPPKTIFSRLSTKVRSSHPLSRTMTQSIFRWISSILAEISCPMPENGFLSSLFV